MITLRGMTWAHTRGFVPMAATAQRYQELHPGVEIVWEKRSLRDFEEFPVEGLAARYDLLVIDHAFVGFAARHRVLQPLDELLPPKVRPRGQNMRRPPIRSSGWVWKFQLSTLLRIIQRMPSGM